MKTSVLSLAAIAVAVALLDPGRAEACGGCFVPQVERTVVTDHRMALSVSTEQTVLWDQIRYAGDPKEFAWVLPVRAGAKIEVSNDEWFAALDASTQPAVYQPSYVGGSYGCALTGCSADSTSDSSLGGSNVQILSQSVVGPYETVTLRSTDPDSLTKWLQSHAFDIPSSIEPTISAYVHEGFDFIALRLQPSCNERSMRPVRIVTKGADPTLPLRMVAAGVGANVGITLYIISEGRWHPQNFKDGVLDDSKLRWNRTTYKSNYDDVSKDLMAQNNGRTWHVEYADKPDLYSFTKYGPATSTSSSSSGYYPYTNPYYAAGNPGLAAAYYGQCKNAGFNPSGSSSSSSSSGSSGSFTPCPQPTTTSTTTPPPPPPPPPPPKDAGADADDDAGDVDASTEAGTTDGGTSDAGSDSGTEDDAGDDAGTTTPPTGECGYLDDMDVALRGLHSADVWVTRIRAVLPANALSEGDLRLEASTDQSPVSNVHYAAYYADEDRSSTRAACTGAPKEHTVFGSWGFAAAAALGVVSYMRRRKSKKR